MELKNITWNNFIKKEPKWIETVGQYYLILEELNLERMTNNLSLDYYDSIRNAIILQNYNTREKDVEDL